ncbi:hypothetical protein BOTBODRAFT_539468 [Botryobasidium botryosum FD-172 SS1]|uniref:Uncharacterized protein n=1 Tax=Botryobasidium botryosum (strain FD-172 SS1) TaxID=930990 RepID=A0A067M085_BOTB1|nr:hypothetical protein BOTBODRAFT_539468 [Botryobasidium botryosum FD-172 SS1]
MLEPASRSCHITSKLDRTAKSTLLTLCLHLQGMNAYTCGIARSLDPQISSLELQGHATTSTQDPMEIFKNTYRWPIYTSRVFLWSRPQSPARRST